MEPHSKSKGSHPKAPNVIENYYGGEDYYSTNNKLSGSYPELKRTHYKRKKASMSLSSKSSIDSIPFSEFTPNPHFNIISNELLQSMTVQFNSNEFYINSKDDISDTNSLKSTTDHDNHTDGVCIDDSSSINSSTTSMDIDLNPYFTETSITVLNNIKYDNEESHHHPLLGMILVTLSSVCYSALNLSVGALMTETPWQQLMFIRMCVTWIATLIWILIRYQCKLSLCGPKHQRILLILRSFFLWGAMFTCWWSFSFIPVGDATTLQTSFPLIVAIIAHFIWRDQRLDIFGWIFVLAGLIGVVFVAQPSFIFGHSTSENSSTRNIGILLGIASSICAGSQFVLVNYTKKDCHWLQIEQLTSALSVFVLCPIGAVSFGLYYYNANENNLIIPWESLSIQRWFEETALGLLGFTALALLTRGSQLDHPSRTSICTYLIIPFTYLGQSILTKHIPNLFVFIGIFLVLCSVIIPAIRKLRKYNKERKIFNKATKKHQNTFSGDDETAPLLIARDNNEVGGGVTVDWSSSNCSSDYDENKGNRALL